MATPGEIKKWKQKGRDEVDEGLPGWFGTFADMMTLLFAFFVLLAAISTIDPVKLQEMADGMGKSVGKKEKLENQASSLSDIKKAVNAMVDEMEADPETGEKPEMIGEVASKWILETFVAEELFPALSLPFISIS